MTDEPILPATEDEALQMIADGFKAFVSDTVRKIVEASDEAAEDNERLCGIAIAVCESITLGVLCAIPIRHGSEGKVLKQSRERIMAKMAGIRIWRRGRAN